MKEREHGFAPALAVGPAGSGGLWPLRGFPKRRSEHQISYRALVFCQFICGCRLGRNGGNVAGHVPDSSHVVIRLPQYRHWRHRMVRPPKAGRVWTTRKRLQPQWRHSWPRFSPGSSMTVSCSSAASRFAPHSIAVFFWGGYIWTIALPTIPLCADVIPHRAGLPPPAQMP